MLLAAGRGERMRPLTDHTPKPLLRVGGKPLLQWHIERLVTAGIHELVINHAHLGAQIEAAFGDGARFGARISYSPEPQGALETAGGIAQALSLLGDKPFLVISGDIHCDWDPRRALEQPLGDDLAHLMMVPNPDFHPEGDFHYAAGRLYADHVAAGMPRLTFGNVGIYEPRLFADIVPGTVAKLGPLLRAAIAAGRVSAERHDGPWHNLGTPDQLTTLNAQLVGAGT